MLTTYVVATQPIAPRARRALGIGDVMLGHRAALSLRALDQRSPAGAGRRRSAARRRAGARARVDRRLTQRARLFAARYPALEAIAFEYAWEGLFATTPDGLPYIGPHRRYPRHLFALGYGGNGMTFGFLAAGLLLDWYAETDRPITSSSRLAGCGNVLLQTSYFTLQTSSVPLRSCIR